MPQTQAKTPFIRAHAETWRRCGVRRLEVFGSAPRGQDFDPSRGDADFRVDLANDGGASPFGAFFGLTRYLEALLGQPVDRVSPSALLNPQALRTIERAEPIEGARVTRLPLGTRAAQRTSCEVHRRQGPRRLPGRRSAALRRGAAVRDRR